MFDISFWLTCFKCLWILGGGKPSGGTVPANAAKGEFGKPSQKKDAASVSGANVVPEKKVADRPPEKERKKDVPHPRMQFDDQHRVEKAKKRAVVNQSEARNRVELFRHLPQYVHGTQLPDLESKFFQLDQIHPSVYKASDIHPVIHSSKTFLR